MRPKLSCFGISLAHKNTKGGQYGRTEQANRAIHRRISKE